MDKFERTENFFNKFRKISAGLLTVVFLTLGAYTAVKINNYASIGKEQKPAGRFALADKNERRNHQSWPSTESALKDYTEKIADFFLGYGETKPLAAATGNTDFSKLEDLTKSWGNKFGEEKTDEYLNTAKNLYVRGEDIKDGIEKITSDINKGKFSIDDSIGLLKEGKKTIDKSAELLGGVSKSLGAVKSGNILNIIDSFSSAGDLIDARGSLSDKMDNILKNAALGDYSFNKVTDLFKNTSQVIQIPGISGSSFDLKINDIFDKASISNINGLGKIMGGAKGFFDDSVSKYADKLTELVTDGLAGKFNISDLGGLIKGGGNIMRFTQGGINGVKDQVDKIINSVTAGNLTDFSKILDGSSNILNFDKNVADKVEGLIKNALNGVMPKDQIGKLLSGAGKILSLDANFAQKAFDDVKGIINKTLTGSLDLDKMSSLMNKAGNLFEKMPDETSMKNLINSALKSGIADAAYLPELIDILGKMNDLEDLNPVLIKSFNGAMSNILAGNLDDDALNIMLDNFNQTGNFGGPGTLCFDDPNPQNLQPGENTYAFCCDETCCGVIPCLPSCKDQAGDNNYIYDYLTMDCGIDN